MGNFLRGIADALVRGMAGALSDTALPEFHCGGAYFCFRGWACARSGPARVLGWPGIWFRFQIRGSLIVLFAVVIFQTFWNGSKYFLGGI